MDPPSDADGQFLVGLQMIQQSHNRRVEELLREVEHWKRQSQQFKQQFELADQQSKEAIIKSNQNIAELKRLLAEKQQELSSMMESRNQALSQVAQLKAQAGQLQNFKRAISAMVTDGDTFNLQQTLTDFNNLTVGGLNAMDSPARVDYSIPGRSSTSYLGPSSSSLQANGGGASIGGGPSAMRSTSPAISRPVARDADPARADEPLDAAAYYQQVKEILEPQAFRDFAANIKRLNAGQQTVADTLRNVREIFGDQRPYLFSQLQKLIHQAEEDARRQAQNDAPAYR